MTSFIKAHRHRITFGRVTGLTLVVVFVIQGLVFLGKNKKVAVPSGNVRLTFGITDLYAPFLTQDENARVLNSMPQGVEVFATYRHTKYSFRLARCMIGVGCVIFPGWDEKSTEQRRKFSAEITPDGTSSVPRTFSVDMPSSLDGGYVLSGLYIALSADELYSQPSYRALVEKIPAHLLDRDPPKPAFQYLVDFREYETTQPRRRDQDCLFVSMPRGLPEIKLPIVVRIETDLKQMFLTRVMQRPCPLVGEYSANRSDAQSDSLPPSRIAAAQAQIDFAGARRANRFSGPLPVPEDTVRWSHRNNEGVRASLIEFGPFVNLWIRGDNADSSRAEIWSFFNDNLIGHSGTIFYAVREKDIEKIAFVRWDRYFHDGKSVWKKVVPEHCDEQGCENAQAEILSVMSKPYDALLTEARSYLQLRGALQPEKEYDD